MAEGTVESEDSELAAFLDEGLFGGQKEQASLADGAAAQADLQLPEAGNSAQPAEQQALPLDSEDREQQAKRQRTDVSASDKIAQQICPPHPGYWVGMCIRCGAPKPQQVAAPAASNSSARQQADAAPAMTRIKHLHHKPGALEVSADEAARIATDGVKKLIASRRLVLVLDLDHTLLNTVRDGDLRGPEREAALKIIQQQKDAMQRYQQNGQSTASADGTAAEEETDTALKAEQQQQNRSPTPQLYHLADKGLWTKLRPGVEQFLAAVAPLYELHIYTMGDKGYAGLMADLLDPEHKLFVGRVISAADSTRAGVKDLDVLLSDESLVLILDDTEVVWENHKANLIQVERYHFFGASATSFYLKGQTPLQSGTDEPAEGGMLDKAAQLLIRLHARVYGPGAGQQQQHQQDQPAEAGSAFDQAAAEVQDEQQQHQQEQMPGRRAVHKPRALSNNLEQHQQQQGDSSGSRPSTPAAASVLVSDVRQCLEAELKSILAGCCIVFSRCWPNTGHSPADHPLWQLVLRMGGQCSMNFAPGVTTHVLVAPDKNDPGQIPLTDKVRAAQGAGVPIVHPDWLLACKFSWARQPEEQYALPQYTGAGVGGFSSSKFLGPPPKAAAVAQERQAVLKTAGRTG